MEGVDARHLWVIVVSIPPGGTCRSSASPPQQGTCRLPPPTVPFLVLVVVFLQRQGSLHPGYGPWGQRLLPACRRQNLFQIPPVPSAVGPRLLGQNWDPEPGSVTKEAVDVMAWPSASTRRFGKSRARPGQRRAPERGSDGPVLAGLPWCSRALHTWSSVPSECGERSPISCRVAPRKPTPRSGLQKACWAHGAAVTVGGPPNKAEAAGDGGPEGEASPAPDTGPPLSTVSSLVLGWNGSRGTAHLL